ncbi:MAG TPA: hypothetical protein VFD36_20685 [Kofleriaceae bacterium]|nr:hypothetical protein [Kofleriaceae bacterium]
MIAGDREPGRRRGPQRKTTSPASVANRVVVQKARPPKRDRSKPKRYRIDKARVGQGYKVFCASFPPDKLFLLDAFALRAELSRSALLLKAFEYYAGHVGSPPPGETS